MKGKSIGMNALLNVFKQCSNIIFPLITFPYVSRILGSESLGKYNFAYSIIGYLALVAALGIPTYAVREGAKVRDDKEKLSKFACQIFTLNIIITVIAFILFAVAILLFDKLQGYTSLIVILSTTVLFTTLGVDWINTIYEDYVFIVVRDVIFKFIALVLMFVLVRSTKDYIIYAAITSIAESAKGLLNFFYIRKYVRLHIVKDVEFKKHIVPILILFCNALAITIYVNSDITLVGIFKGDTEVGIYSTSTKVYSICKSVLNAIVIVFIPRMSYLISKNTKEEYDSMLNKMLNTLVVIILPVVIGINMLSTEIITILGGKEYMSGSMSLKILSISIIFAIITSFYSNSILIPNRKDKEYFLATLEAAVINLVLNFIFIPTLGINGAAITTLIAEVVVMIQVMRYSKELHGKINIKKSISTSIVGCFAIALVCTITKMIFSNIYFYFVLSMIVSGIVYILIQIVLKNEVIMDALNLVLSKVGVYKNDQFKKIS
ncbi:MAG: flippase [Clostridium sp.]|nr:flippase [Clostridium sp.]